MRGPLDYLINELYSLFRPQPMLETQQIAEAFFSSIRSVPLGAIAKQVLLEMTQGVALGISRVLPQ